MNCQDARECFSELLESHIGLTELAPLEAHLRECEACQQELEALRLSERPRPAAWRPSFKFDSFSKALDGLRPADMVDRLRRRVFPRNRVIPRARARPVLFGKTLEALWPADTLTPRRSVHARARIPWRSRFGAARATKVLAAVRRIDIVAPLHRAVSSLDQVVRRAPPALDAGGKALQVAQKALGIVQKVLEIARQTLLVTGALAIGAWHHRGVLLRVQARHLRLTATVLLVSLGAVGLFRYRAELDVAVRHWVPSAPSSGDATPPTRTASTEPATRPEIPPGSVPATVVPAPPARKSSIPPPAPVTPRRAPAPSPPVRDTRASRIEKPDATKSDASPAQRRGTPLGTMAASTTPANGDARPSLDVVGKLRVKSRSGAERDLAALVAKAGGTTVSRQRGDKITVIEAGRSRLPDPVRVTVRLAE